jgi:hypothetical protein
MFKSKKMKSKWALVLAAMSALLASPVFGADTSASDSDSLFGLPRSATSPSEVVGTLPISTQWISEQTSSYLYVTYNASTMGSSTLSVGQYTADFGSTGFAYPSVDFFAHLFSLASPESRSALRDFSVWGRYSLGFADRSANLSAADGSVDSAVENDSLLIFSARVGLLLGYDYPKWVRPYAGFEISPYYFRNTSGISGAEEQGENFTYGPVLGLHFPVLFSGKASLLAEYRRTIPASSGAGLTF